MSHLRRFFSKLVTHFRNTHVEDELKREIDSHLTLLEDDFRQQGISRDEARLAARRAYGGVERAKQLHRNERSLLWFEQTRQSFRYAFRQIRKSPGFSITVVLTLALGIGTTTAIFSLIDGILLRPLPFSHPDHLVLLGDHLGSGLDLGVTAQEIAWRLCDQHLRTLRWCDSGSSPRRPAHRRRFPDPWCSANTRPRLYKAGRGCSSVPRSHQLRLVDEPLSPRSPHRR